MSSMIPIFIIPIAVLDAIHIVSEFFDRYQATKDRKKTIHDVMNTLFMPMLFTSLTTVAGFASLALTPIPPVQTLWYFCSDWCFCCMAVNGNFYSSNDSLYPREGSCEFWVSS